MRKPLILFAALALGLSSCADDIFDCKEGNGNITTVVRPVEPFVAVSADGSFEVILEKGTTNEVRIEAESNIAPHVVSLVDRQTLLLQFENHTCINQTEKVRIYVTYESLEAVNLSGSGIVRGNGIEADNFNLLLNGSGTMDLEVDCDKLEARVTGSGRVELSGSANRSELHMSGSGELDALALPHDQCVARVVGSGDILAFVRDLLDAEVTGSGNVYYLGDPTIREEITGSGTIQRY